MPYRRYEMMSISKHQLFCLIVLFEIGSTTLFALGIEAKQDAWIVIIFSAIIGIILIVIYTELQKQFPKKNFIEIVFELLGKSIGRPLAFLYGLFFLYGSSRNLRDFSELMKITFLARTPRLVLHITIMAVMVYIIILGLTVLGRTSEIMLPIFMFCILITIMMVIISPEFDIKELFPILSNGIKPILNSSFPMVINFPYGEAFAFSMIWCYTNSKKDIRKVSILAIILFTVLLVISTIIIICTIGVDYASISTLPLLEVIKMIDVGNILTNLDAVGVIILFIGGFYKTVIFLYAAVLSFSTLFEIKSSKWLMLIICAIFETWFSIVFESSYAYHIWLGHKASLPYLYNTFQIIIPPLLLIICWLKIKVKKSRIDRYEY
jgi:spore germination protein KB